MELRLHSPVGAEPVVYKWPMIIGRGSVSNDNDDDDNNISINIANGMMMMMMIMLVRDGRATDNESTARREGWHAK